MGELGQVVSNNTEDEASLSVVGEGEKRNGLTLEFYIPNNKQGLLCPFPNEYNWGFISFQDEIIPSQHVSKQLCHNYSSLVNFIIDKVQATLRPCPRLILSLSKAYIRLSLDDFQSKNLNRRSQQSHKTPFENLNMFNVLLLKMLDNNVSNR